MPAILDNEDEIDEPLQELFTKVNPIYDLTNVGDDEEFKRILTTADGSQRYSTPKLGTSMRLGTSTGVSNNLTAMIIILQFFFITVSKIGHWHGTPYRI